MTTLTVRKLDAVEPLVASPESSPHVAPKHATAANIEAIARDLASDLKKVEVPQLLTISWKSDNKQIKQKKRTKMTVFQPFSSCLATEMTVQKLRVLLDSTKADVSLQ